jgi:hypothetical protein
MAIMSMLATYTAMALVVVITTATTTLMAVSIPRQANRLRIQTTTMHRIHVRSAYC